MRTERAESDAYMKTDEMIIENNTLQLQLHEIMGKLESGAYLLPEEAASQLGGALAAVITPAGELDRYDADGSSLKLLMEMVNALESALLRQNVQTAEGVVKAIGESLIYLQRVHVLYPEDTQEQLLERGERILSRLNMIVQLQDSMDIVNEQVRRLEEQQLLLDTRKKDAGREMRELLQTSDGLREEIALYKDSGRILSTGLLDYIQSVNHYLRSGNLSEKNRVVLNRQRQVQGQVETMLSHLNMIAFGSPRLLGNVSLERLEKISRQFREDMLQAEKESDTIEQLSRGVEDTIETIAGRAKERDKERMERSSKLMEEFEQFQREREG